MISAPPQIPTYAQGFARHAGDSACPGLWDGLVGAWVASLGPTGWTLFDASGRHNHGTLTNMDPATDWVIGPNGWTLDFDGVDDYVDLGRSWAFGDFSVALWFKIPNLTADHAIAGNWNGDATHDGWEIWFDDVVGKFGGLSDVVSFVIFGDASANNWLWITSSQITAPGWYHLAVTRRNGADAKMYINSEEDTAHSQSANLNLTIATSPNVRFGRSLVPRNSAGSLADALFWDRTLSAQEVAFLYGNPHALLQPQRRTLGIIPPIDGPYRAAAGQAFHTGAAAGQTFITTATAGQIDGRSH